ncbi:TPA: hypothetical protein ACX369_003247 [Serratia marcescens]
MDNKLSELSKPEQFDAEVEIHGGEPFAVWAPAVNGSHVKAELYFSLLAELKSSQAIANEYQQLMYHMDAGGDFYEFQRDKAKKEQSNG